MFNLDIDYKGLDLLATASALRTRLWCGEVSFQAYSARHNGDFIGNGWRARMLPRSRVHIEVDGGKKELAQLIGGVPRRQQCIPFDTIKTYCHLYLDGLEKAYPLAESVTYTRKNKNTAAKTSIVLSSIWTHAYTSDDLRVPILCLPPMTVVPPYLHLGVQKMEMAALAQLVQNRATICAEIDWHKLGIDLGLGKKLIDSVVNEWCSLGRWRQVHAGWELGDSEQVRKAREMITMDALNDLTN